MNAKTDAKNLGLHDFFLRHIDKGEIQLPEFQREYVWKDGDARALLESVLNSHPIGTVMLLELDPADPMLGSTMLADVLTSPTAKGAKPKYLVLDGQQRLTTLSHMALGHPKHDWYLRIQPLFQRWIDAGKPTNAEDLSDWMRDGLELEDLIVKRKRAADVEKLFRDNDEPQLPLRLLRDINNFNQRIGARSKDYLHLEFQAQQVKSPSEKPPKSKGKKAEPSATGNIHAQNHGAWAEFLNCPLKAIADNFFNFSVPSLIIPQRMSMAGVCKVFTRLNTTGIELGAFDLTVARLFPKSILLKKEFETAIAEHKTLKALDSNKKIYTLSTMTLLAGKSSKTASLPSIIDADLFHGYWSKAVEQLDSACKAVSEYCGAGLDRGTDRILSYAPLLPALAVVLSKHPIKAKPSDGVTTELSLHRQHKLCAWYFGAAVAERYSEGTDNKQWVDSREMSEWFADPNDVNFLSSKTPKWLLERKQLNLESTRSGALYKALLCLLNMQATRDWFQQAAIVGCREASDDSDVHHIFPLAALRTQYTQKGYSKAEADKQIIRDGGDSILNKTWLLESTNRGIISDQTPSKYLEKIINQLGGPSNPAAKHTLAVVLANHCISGEGLEALLKDDFAGFMADRKSQFLQLLRTRGHVVNIVENSTQSTDSDDGQ